MSRLVLALILMVGLVTAANGETLVIQGGTVHPVSGEPFVGTVVVQDGVITAVGSDAAAPSGATTIDATGLHVYPGMVDALSQVGLLEINAVAATDDRAEIGGYNSHLRAATAIHPSSEVIPVTRSTGITQTLVAPRTDRDGVIAGQAALVNLDGWTVDEMAIDPAIAMVVSWPAIVTRSFDFSTFSWKDTPYNEAKENAEEKANELRDWVDAGRHYRQATEAGSTRTVRDLKLAAIASCLSGEMPVIILAHNKSDIEAAVKFAEAEGIDLILAGAKDAYKVKDMLAEKNIPVVLGPVLRLPSEDDEPYDQPFRLPSELVEAGIKIAFGSGAATGWGSMGPHGSRTTVYEASIAAAHGLSDEDALKAMTIWPAEILGVGDRLGTIEVGKIGNLIVTNGDPLEITVDVQHLIIGGQVVPTTNMHQELYEKYSSRELPGE